MARWLQLQPNALSTDMRPLANFSLIMNLARNVKIKILLLWWPSRLHFTHEWKNKKYHLNVIELQYWKQIGIKKTIKQVRMSRAFNQQWVFRNSYAIEALRYRCLSLKTGAYQNFSNFPDHLYFRNIFWWNRWNSLISNTTQHNRHAIARKLRYKNYRLI